MYKVVGYEDLRPVDWASGKRMPLAAGEGHICDRCEREHAIIFKVQDTETGKLYSVGSGCAQKTFGFDPEKTDECKKIVKTMKKELELQVHQHRWEETVALAGQIADEVRSLRRPEIVKEDPPAKYPLVRAIFVCGDAEVSQSSYTTDQESASMALWHWVKNRVVERIPADWSKIGVGTDPHRPKGTFMNLLCEKFAMQKLRDLR
jgi:hypothetical protein